MKIVQVIPQFGLGGGEIMCENLIYGLIKQGHEVVAVSLYHKETAITQRLESAGVYVQYLHKKNGFDRSIYKKLRLLLKELNPDVVHTHLYATKYAFPVARKLKIRAVHTLHSVAKIEAGWLTRRFNSVFFHHFHVTPVALSGAVQKTVLDEYRLKPNNVPVILNGIDLSKCQVKKNYDVEGNFKILHIGSFRDVKNQQMLIEAFSRFHGKYPQSELRLIGEGVTKNECEELAQALGISDSVHFLGAQSSVFEHMGEADMFVLPSVYEGIPMTLIEAMGTALPIVATMVGGIPDMLRDGHSALLTEVSTEALAHALETMYTDPELRKMLANQAKTDSVLFSSDEMAQKYVEIYSKEQ